MAQVVATNGRRVVVGVLACLALSSTSAWAQRREPIPVVVADVRGAMVGLPTAEGWTPVVPAGGEVPSRALGFELGGHVRLVKAGFTTLGIGATYLIGRSTFVPEPPATASDPLLPEITTRFTSFTPQLSFNFGHRLGFSYLSVGYGRARVSSSANQITQIASPEVLEREWSRALNYGAGVRWFINDHFGVNFDLRWHQVSAIAATTALPAAPRQTMFTAGVGVSFQ